MKFKIIELEDGAKAVVQEPIEAIVRIDFQGRAYERLEDIIRCKNCEYEEFCERKIHRHGITYDINFCSYGKRKF